MWHGAGKTIERGLAREDMGAFFGSTERGGSAMPLSASNGNEVVHVVQGGQNRRSTKVCREDGGDVEK